MKYGTILADPPWSFSNSMPGHGDPRGHYPCMSTEEIASLPVRQLAADDAVLLLWSTWAHLPEALFVLGAWGFTYKSGMPWVKLAGEPQTDLFDGPRFRLAYGSGYWVRGCTEPLLIASRGRVAPPVQDAWLGILAERLEHSRKPDSVYVYAESSTFPGPRVELFARRRREGWDAWGNQVNATVDMPVVAPGEAWR